MARGVICGLVFFFLGGAAQAVDNPLSVALNGSVIRHNGVYFGMENSSNATLVVSDNLMDWTPISSVLEPVVAGPYELLDRNGLFSLYVRSRAYTAADQPMGPFPKLRRIDFPGEDLRMFQNADGALYSIYRKEGSKKEGEIWMQRMAAPGKRAGSPWQLLDGRRSMWDSTESAELGDPEMVDYRGNYYLLYASNHASPRTGLREIGWAINAEPRKFKNIDRQADLLLMRNTERLARTYTAILPPGEYMEWAGHYTLVPPEEGWALPGFNGKGWRTGKGGFGFPFKEGETKIQGGRTEWKGESLWVRRTFRLTGAMPETPVLNIRQEGAVQVFLNGKMVFESSDPTRAYGNFDLSDIAAGFFRKGENVLAVHAVANRADAFRFLDYGLFDAGSHPVEPTVCNLDAPCVVEGPNGFEKWLTYHAYWNGAPGTGMDRIFFFGEEMVVDGPTTAKTPGYHPPPARPTFSDGFPAAGSAWRTRWLTDGDGAWSATNGVLRQTFSKGTARIFLRQNPAKNYLFETGIRFPKTGENVAGVVAFHNGKHTLSIGINPAKRSWSYRIEPNGTMKRFKLPTEFKAVPGALHRLRITKNAGDFEVILDRFALTAKEPLATSLFGAGVPGLFCRASAAEFDGVAYTVGWDEHGERIAGWGAAADGSLSGGEWRLRKAGGLEQRRHSEPGRAFKGDLLDQYEFTVNVRTEKLEEGKNRQYGVFPVFVDPQNYLKAMIDTRRRELVVSGRRNGKEIGPWVKSLKRRIPHRPLYDKATAYREVAAWLYALRSPSIVTGLDIRWLEGKYAVLQQDFSLPSDELLIRYANLPRGRKPILWDDGRFCTADEPKPGAQEAGRLNPISIRPETGNHIGFGVVVSSEILGEDRDPKKLKRPYYSSRPQETLVTVEVESSYFFRCVKQADRVVIELNGQPMLSVEGEWPAAQVGLLTEGQPCFFDGITLMHLPSH